MDQKEHSGPCTVQGCRSPLLPPPFRFTSPPPLFHLLSSSLPPPLFLTTSRYARTQDHCAAEGPTHLGCDGVSDRGIRALSDAIVAGRCASLHVISLARDAPGISEGHDGLACLPSHVLVARVGPDDYNSPRDGEAELADAEEDAAARSGANQNEARRKGDAEKCVVS